MSSSEKNIYGLYFKVPGRRVREALLRRSEVFAALASGKEGTSVGAHALREADLHQRMAIFIDTESVYLLDREEFKTLEVGEEDD